MKRPFLHPPVLILLSLLATAANGAPPPYWPPYPPSPYYPLPPASPATATPAEANLETAEEPMEEEAKDEFSPAETIETNASADVEQPPPLPEPAPVTDDIDAKETDSAEALELSEGGDATTETPAQATNEWELAREIRAAIQQGNFAEAYYLWRPRAEAGNADAQYGIGWMYHNGYGLAINDDEASAWWELAARQGHTDATFALGMLYGLGEGPVKRDMARAVDYYHQAALKGHEDARLLLRTLMAEGDKAALQLMVQLLNEARVAEITSPATVISNKANVRRGPSTKHKVLTTLEKEHPLMPLRRDGRWLMVGIKGKSYTGWIHDSLVGRAVLATSDN